MSKISKAATRTVSIETLRQILKPGDTVFTVLRSVSSTGMTRVISAVIIEDGCPRPITHYVAQATGRGVKYGFTDGVVCKGCGMDMGFDLVHQLGQALFGDGYKLRQEWL